MLTQLRITIDAKNRTSDIVGSETRYGYSLHIDGGNIGTVSAESIYGAQYALESFVQLLSQDCKVLHSKVHIQDQPQYQWRGFVNLCSMLKALVPVFNFFLSCQIHILSWHEIVGSPHTEN